MAFRGITIPIAFGSLGFTGTKSVSLARPGEVVCANGIAWDGGSIVKERGLTKYNSTVISSSPDVLSGHDYWPTSTGQRLLLSTDDGKLLRFVSGSLTHTMASSLTVGANDVPVWLDVYGTSGSPPRNALYFSGSNQVKILVNDGTGMADLTNPATDWGSAYPHTGTVHDQRAFAAGNSNNPHGVYYSTFSDQTDFAGATSGVFVVYPSVGERIEAITSWRGRLVVFKYPVGIFLVDTGAADLSSAFSDLNVPSIQMISPNVGCAGHAAYAHVNNDIIFLTSTGEIKSLSSTEAFGDGTLASLSRNQDISSFIRRTFDPASFPLTRMLFYDQKQELHIAMRRSGSSELDSRMVLDLENFQVENNPPRWRYTYGREEIGSLWLARDTDGIKRPMYGGSGDDAGYAWNMDVADTYTKDGAVYLSELETVADDLSGIQVKGQGNPNWAVRDKNFHALDLIADPEDSTSLTFNVIIDDRQGQTLTFNVPGRGADFPMDFPVTLGGGTYYRQRKDLHSGSGRTIAFRMTHFDSASFSIGQTYLSFTEADENKTRVF